MRILFQGLKGAFSEAVATRLRDALFSVDASISIQLESVASFAALTEGCSDVEGVLGALPVSNTLGGPVETALAALAAYRPAVLGEHRLLAKQHLWARKGVKLTHVKTVASHPQALAQCRKTIEKYKLTTLETPNTAVAAARLGADEKVPFEAAISSQRAGLLYGLQRLLANVQDSDDNTTTFLLLGTLPRKLSLGLQQKLQVEASLAVFLRETATSSKGDETWIEGQRFLLKKVRAPQEVPREVPLNPQSWMIL